MSEFSMDDLRDMAPAYVLGALNADEQDAFERALNTSSLLAQEVAEYRAVVTQVGTAQQLAPPPALRARFLDGIAAKKSDASPNTASPAVDARPFTVSRGNAPQNSKPADGNGTSKRGGGNLWLTGVMAIGMAASLVFAIQRNAEVSTMRETLAQRDSVLQARNVLLAQRDSTLNTLFEAERSLVLVNLESTPNTGPGMQFFWNVKERRGVIHAFRLKPAAPGRAYQLWLIKDGKAVPSRVFTADADAHGLVWGIELPENTRGVTAVAITDEPAGGSLQPTTTPFLVGELPKGVQ